MNFTNTLVRGFFLANQQEYQKAFPDNPGNGPAGYERLVYSIESPGGSAFFAVLDAYYVTEDTTSEGAKIDGTQLAWLANKVAKTKAIHKFAFMHPPYYQVFGSQSSVSTTLTKLWSLLDINRFDMFLCGHVHLFSWKTIDRSLPPDPQPNPPVPAWKNSVVQLICGTCGAPPDSSTPTVNPALWHISQGANTYYFSVVDIQGNRVTVTSYRGNTSDYNVFDTFTITKDGITGVNLLLLR